VNKIAAAECTTYEEIFAIPEYSNDSQGEFFLPLFLDIAKPDLNANILDAGSGSGKGALVLRRHVKSVTMCDITFDGLVPEAEEIPRFPVVLWHDISIHGQWDYVYCCDVLEHIPTEFTMLVLSRLLTAATKGVFLSITLIPDNFGILIGKSLHQTVQPFTWWRDRLRELGTVIECRDLITTGIYFVRAK
jgi:hypothetical protein